MINRNGCLKSLVWRPRNNLNPFVFKVYHDATDFGAAPPSPLSPSPTFAAPAAENRLFPADRFLVAGPGPKAQGPGHSLKVLKDLQRLKGSGIGCPPTRDWMSAATRIALVVVIFTPSAAAASG